MASDHPFQMLFETFGKPSTAHTEVVNRRAYLALGETLSVPVGSAGRCILLRAPRAGHGKTHLLTRVQQKLAAGHEFIPLHAVSGSRIDAASITDDALRRLLRQLPGSAGLSVLDLIVRRLFAVALQPLVRSGEVPCQDREGALAALRNRPVETFDFHHPNAVTAHWARENFEVLGPRLSLELSQRTGLPVREISFWVEVLFRFAVTPADHPERVRALGEAVSGAEQGEGVAMERLAALLGLLALLVRVVLVADELEGFSADESAALKFAAILGALRQSVESLDVVISLNRDIWQSAFVPRLSGGLADRLSEVVIELEPLTESEIISLLDSRVPGLGAEVLDHIDLHKAETHPRGLLRAAAATWLEALERREASTSSFQESASEFVPPIAEAAAEETVREGEEEFAGPGKMESPPLPSGEPETETAGTDETPAEEEPVFAKEVEIQPQPQDSETEPPPLREVTREETDRVDDLLRQFRERYGRGGL